MKEIQMNKYYKFLAYVVVVILVNLVSMNLFFRIDLTKDRIYSISKVSQQVVATLSEPLTIHCFFTQNLPAPHNNTERYLRDLLMEYAIHGNKYFNYIFHDVDVKDGETGGETNQNQEMAQNYGIYPLQVQNIEQDEVKFQRAYMGLVIIHGDMIERIPAITDTEGLEYKITTTIQKMNNKISALLRLPEKIQVKLILSSSLEQVAPFMRIEGLEKIPEKMESAVSELNEKTYGRLEFDYIDPTQDPSLEEQLSRYRLMKLEWPELKDAFGKDIPAGKGIAGLILEYGEKVAETQLIQAMEIPLLGPQYQLAEIDDLKEFINESIEYLININENIGYLESQGTLPLFNPDGPMAQQQMQQPALSNFYSLLSQNYSVQQINLEDEEIPESINCLIIASPKEEFSDYDLFQIDQFLMKGKTLAVLIDRFNEIMPQQQQMQYFNQNQGPFYIPINTGLEKLLEHYGVSVNNSYLLDESCYKQRMDERYGGGEQPIYFAPIILPPYLNDDLGFMKNINGLIMLKISPLQANEEKIEENNLTIKELFTSSDKGWEMKGRINLNPMFIQPPAQEDQSQQFPLSYVLEGEFPSYFKGKPIPERPVEEEEEIGEEEQESQEKSQKAETPSEETRKITKSIEIIEKGRPGKVFLIGSSEFIKDNLIDEEGKSPDAVFILNVLDYLNGRENIAVMRSKQQQINLLKDTSGGTKTFLKTFNIMGLPILVILAGILIWLHRKQRKHQIQQQFHK
ncbi:MAG: Gldg family protein [Candidatus Aminicenantes bacterium]|nr:Gldg family protein [Candidatus Aminicenantes bacterium]